MKVLVTGGNGFIGKHVVHELVGRNIEVVSYDIVKPSIKLEGVQYVYGTVLDEFLLSQCMKGCDAVIHLAAILGVKRAEKELLKCMTINLEGTLKVLRTMVMNDIEHVLLTSSSEVFGDVSRSKLNETSPFNPKSGYAISKLACEQYLQGFNDEFGLNYNVVRFFNIYGSGQVAEFVVPRFIKMVQKGIAPTIYGDGQQVRSFCHIKDAARATIDLFLNKNMLNDAYHIGNDLESVTMVELANKVLQIMDKKMELNFVPFEKSDRKSSREIFYRIPDITKIQQAIGYAPEITLEDGLKEIIATNDIPESWVDPIC